MKQTKKVIVTCAVTGSIHTPSMSPHLPITPEEIVDAAVGAAEAGASMVHLHARDPQTGRPDQSPALFAQILPRVAERTDAILNVTTGGGLGMSMEQRLAAALWAKPEVASMNMGSLNFNISGAGARVTDFTYDWERPYLEMTRGFILSNTFDEIERAMCSLSGDGARFEFECYDVGHLYNLAHAADLGWVKPPFFIQCIFGILGGIGPDPDNLLHMKSVADKLFGDDYLLSVLAAGRHQMPFVTMSAILGGNVRVGLEDNLNISRGKLAVSNAEQVYKIKRILDELSMNTATPDEARALLQTKGRANVGFS